MENEWEQSLASGIQIIANDIKRLMKMAIIEAQVKEAEEVGVLIGGPKDIYWSPAVVNVIAETCQQLRQHIKGWKELSNCLMDIMEHVTLDSDQFPDNIIRLYFKEVS